MQIAICPMCNQPMRGSANVNVLDPAKLTGIYLLHLIDYHWDLVERIKATTDDPAARQALHESLGKEMTS